MGEQGEQLANPLALKRKIGSRVEVLKYFRWDLIHVCQTGGRGRSLDPSSLDAKTVKVAISDLDYKYMNVCAHNMHVYVSM